MDSLFGGQVPAHSGRSLTSCVPAVARGRGRIAVRASMRRPAPWAGSPAMLAPMASSPTHCANCVRSVQTVATKSEVEARCARWPWALRSSAPQRRIASCPGPALRQRSWCSGERHRGHDLASGGTWQGRFLRRRGAQRRGRRAQRASSSCLPHLFERSAQRVASYAARPRGEHRSAVGPKGRPPQHERLAGAAWRDALNSRRGGCCRRPLCADR